MSETSYSPGYAPYASWSVRQAPVPQTVHNLPTTIPAGSAAQSSVIVTEGFSLISAGITVTQPGVASIQRYLDAGATIAQGSAVQVALVADTPANLDVLDGKPFASFIITITNTSASVSSLSAFALLVQASTASGAGSSSGSGGTTQSVTWSNQSVAVTSLPSIPPGTNAIGTVTVGNFPAVQPVSLSSTPLPSGAAQDGVDGTGITAPTGASGIRGWLSGIYQKLSATLTVSVSGTVPVSGTFYQTTQPVSLASLPLPTGAAQDGTDATGITAPSGASGIRGWLSGIYQKLSATLSVSISGTVPVSGSVLIGASGTDGSTTITTGGTAQNLFGGTVPTNGYAIYNPDLVNDLWVSDSATAATNGQGSIRVVANGGGYETPPGYKPIGTVSIIGASTGQKITARRW